MELLLLSSPHSPVSILYIRVLSEQQTVPSRLRAMLLKVGREIEGDESTREEKSIRRQEGEGR